MYVKYFDVNYPSPPDRPAYTITATEWPFTVSMRLNECQWIVPGTVGVDD